MPTNRNEDMSSGASKKIQRVRQVLRAPLQTWATWSYAGGGGNSGDYAEVYTVGCKVMVVLASIFHRSRAGHLPHPQGVCRQPARNVKF